MTTHPIASEDLKRYFCKDAFARYIGIELLDAHDGWAKTALKIRDHHLNGLKMLHGGAIFTLADLAFAAAANSRGQIAVALSITIAFMREAKGDTVYAEAKELSANRKIATYEVRITDGLEEVIAVFQGMAYKKSAGMEVFETA